MQEEIVKIHTPYIQLDQLLKFSNIISTGGQIKPLLESQQITLNGTTVCEKRKKIYPKDKVVINHEIVLIVEAED